MPLRVSLTTTGRLDKGDGYWRRRQMGKVVLFADAGEVLEVSSVGAQGGGGFGSANVEPQNYKADRTVCFFQFEERFPEK
jgi:hypothetical protein